jgi:3-oxoacyl-[acyl-carrier-protein] synthase-3
MKVGILGVGMCLPSEIRTNDYWSKDLVATWMEVRARQLAALRGKEASTPAIAKVMRAMFDMGTDPFQGAERRHIMAANETSYDLEERAARDALARANVAAGEIDLVLTHTLVPEHLINNSACVLHNRLGLRAQCFSMGTDATSFSFLAQLMVAIQMIRGGGIRRALLVQSCGVTRLVEPADPVAPMFGDGATAVVVGEVAESRGVITTVHRTASAHPFWMGAGARTGRWYDEGRGVLYCPDPVDASHVFLDIPDQAIDAVGALLAQAGRRPEDVDFFAAHQGMPWLRQLAQELSGLGAARTFDTFPFAASVFSANIPLVLRHAEDAGLLRDDQLVVMFGGGTGVTYGAALLHWGR